MNRSACQACLFWEVSLACSTPWQAWIHLKPNCGECCANSCHSQAHGDFGLTGWTEHSSPCHHFTLPYLSLPLTCSAPSRVSHFPPQALSLLQQHQVLLNYSHSEKILPAEHSETPSLLCCCSLTLYVFRLPRKGKSGKKKSSDYCLKHYEEKEPLLE